MEKGPIPPAVGGYVLAGGRSSRMGADKALLKLAGKPLIEHAVLKLSRICAEVYILSSNPALAEYAPLVPDLHPGCGPIGGIEAALSHSSCDWILVLPVDVPLVPTAFLDDWVCGTLGMEKRGARLGLFTVDGVPQPTLALIHRDVLPFVTEAIVRGQFKLYPVLETAGAALAAKLGVVPGRAFRTLPINERLQFDGWQEPHPGPSWQTLTPAQRSARPLWFANLNTPGDFAKAEKYAGALDT